MLSHQPSDPAFRLGRRRLVTQDHTGQPRYTDLPLTVQDYLDPLPDDEFTLGEVHERDVQRIAAALRHHYRYNSAIAVLTRTKVRWNAAIAAHPAPDILLLDNLPEPSRPRALLDLTQEQAGVRAVIEVVAPLFVEQDLVELPALYAAAGVPELWLVDSGLRPDSNQTRYSITGYTLEEGVYRPLAPDATGRLISARGRFYFALAADAQDFILGDTRTGQPIAPPPDVGSSTAARIEAELRAESIAAKLDFLR